MRFTLRNISTCSGFVLAAVLSACSSGGDEADAADEPATSDEPEAGDEPEPGGGSVAIGGTAIGGEESGLMVEIPEEWVDLPMDAGRVSQAVGSLDLTDEQAAFIESWVSTLPSSDGALMAVDSSARTASVPANMSAHCSPNDGRIGRQPGAEAKPLQKSDLEKMIGPAIWDTFGREAIEVESVTVDSYPAARGTTTLELAGFAGVGVQYMFLTDDDICWVTFAGADERSFGLFDEMAATIDVL